MGERVMMGSEEATAGNFVEGKTSALQTAEPRSEKAKKREESKKGFNVIVVGDLGGSTRYQNDDALIGLARYIRNLDSSHKPDMLYIGGGLLPFFPSRGSNRSNDYLDVIIENLESNKHAAAAIKPHMERLLHSLPEKSKVVYVMGEADLRNLDELIRDLGLAFKSGRESIESKMSETITFLVGRQAIVETTSRSMETLSEELKRGSISKADRLSKQKELENARVKLKLNLEEQKEASYRLSLLNQLYSLLLNPVSKEDLKKLYDEKIEEEKGIQAELKDIEKGVKSYEEVSARAKKIANEIRLLEYRLGEINKAEKVSEDAKKNKQIDYFIHNAITPKDSHDIINGLAKSYYLSDIKDAFGRKRKVIIQDNAAELHEFRNGSLRFNIITAYDLSVVPGTYKRSSIDTIPKTFNILKVNGVFDKKTIDAKPLNVIVKSRSNFTQFMVDTLSNNSPSTLAAISQGPLWDRSSLSRSWNSHINTKETQATEKGFVSSGVSELKISRNGSLSYNIISDEKLSFLRMKDDIEESGKLGKRLAGMKQQSNGSPEIIHRPELDRKVAMNHRPSEMKDSELRLLSEEDLAKVLRYSGEGGAQKYDIESFKIAVFTDQHEGNHNLRKLLAAAVDDALKREPNVLVLSGDNIEGFLNDYAQVIRYGMDWQYPKRFREELESMKLSSSEVNRRVAEMLENTVLSVRYNADEQPSMLLENFWALIDSVVERGGAIMVVSGNHPNNSGNGGKHWHRDEATSIGSYIETYLNARIKQLEGSRKTVENAIGAIIAAAFPQGTEISEEQRERLDNISKQILKKFDDEIGLFSKGVKNLRKISGSEYGSEEIKVNGVPMLFSHELGSAKGTSMVGFMENKRSDAVAAFSGHDHECIATYAGGKLLVKVPSNQDSRDNPFLKRISIPVGAPPGSINGYTFIDLKVNKATNSVFEAEVVPVLERSLLRVDKVEEKVRERLTNVEI
ncbi:MAG: hypothetical protein QXK65_01970 [Candidatus Micrarchaeaceae archaeon]